MEILNIESLSFKYPTGENALTDISLKINSGEFILVCGESGCGKTTLLRLIKKQLSPNGILKGRILFNGKDINNQNNISSSDIGFVMQNPENQIVTDKVWHELAFGLENMGLEAGLIRRRVGEMASYFGIEDWFSKNTNELSGGQKQILNLASVMVMQPEILILDEPTSMLDPIAASDFIATLKKLNSDFGLTIILSEHRLEEVFPAADKVLLLSNGKLSLFLEPKDFGREIFEKFQNHPMISGLPSAVRIFNALRGKGHCPLTVREARQFLSDNYKSNKDSLDIPPYINKGKAVIELRNVYFRYEKNSPDILKNANLSVFKGEIYSLLGGNGTGKTTALNVLSGILHPYSGKVLIDGKKVGDYKPNELYREKLSVLPQNPQTVFIKSTLFEDFTEVTDVMGYSEEEAEKHIAEISETLGISGLLYKHPYDLSGGEQQKAALSKLLLLKPQILLLDEPTKGIDAHSKLILSDILKKLKEDGITFLIVTHDIEFASVISDRCGLFFDGDIISEDTPNRFFSGNNFYTTAANRLSRHLYKNAVTCEDVIKLCRKNEI